MYIIIKKKKKKKKKNNNNWFLYSAFLVWDTTQSALQYIITPVTGFNINPALIVHLLNSLGSILARCYFRGAHMPHHATNNVRILPGTHLYTWVESSNVDKVSCWRTKSARHWRESNPEPFDPESDSKSDKLMLVILLSKILNLMWWQLPRT